MDVKTVFRQLVLGQTIPDFDYKTTRFGFQTVFHKDLYSYCICICGFEHEYFDYINNCSEGNVKQSKESCSGDKAADGHVTGDNVTDNVAGAKVTDNVICDNVTSENVTCENATENVTGANVLSCKIDEDMYNKVVQNIVSGYCPHVENVPDEYLQDTYVYGIHIAAAVGSDAILTMRNLRNNIYGGLYKLDPYGVALMKDSVVARMAGNIFNEFPSHWYEIIHFVGLLITGTRDNQSTQTDMVNLNMKNIIEFCMEKADVQILRSYFEIYPFDLFGNYPESVEALKLSHRLNLSEVTELLLQCKSDIKWSNIEKIEAFAKLFIIINEPKHLENILNLAAGKSFDLKLNELACICKVLQRSECQSLVTNESKKARSLYGKKQKMKISKRDEMRCLLELLLDKNLEDKLIKALQSMSDLPSFINSTNKLETWLHRCYRIEEMKCLFDLGLDINMTNIVQKTSFTVFLETMLAEGQGLIRGLMEFCIFQNPDLEKHAFLMMHAITDDKDVYKPKGNVYVSMTKPCKMDGKPHGLFGHDDNADFALNFATPFLLEAGFSIIDREIEELVREEDHFHPSVINYVETFVSNPRPLVNLSCGALRRHFKGRNIQRYVKLMDIPPSIKDIILLKPLLKNVPKEMMEV